MKFYFISKSDYSKYEAPESSDRGTAAAQASVATKKSAGQSACHSVGQSANDSIKIYFKEKRELDRRVRQAVHRYLKRALIQLEN